MYKLTFTFQCGEGYGGRYVKDLEGQGEEQLSLARGIKENFIEELTFEIVCEFWKRNSLFLTLFK